MLHRGRDLWYNILEHLSRKELINCMKANHCMEWVVIKYCFGIHEIRLDMTDNIDCCLLPMLKNVRKLNIHKAQNLDKITQLSNLQVLRIESSDSEYDHETFSNSLKYLSNLSEFICGPVIYSSIIPSLLMNNRELQTLTIKLDRSVEDNYIHFALLTRLKNLDITMCCRGATLSKLSNALASFVHLESLTIRGLNNNCLVLNMLMADKPSTLQVFELYSGSMSIYYDTNIYNMQSLNLSHSALSYDAFIRLLMNNPNLEHLEVRLDKCPNPDFSALFKLITLTLRVDSDITSCYLPYGIKKLSILSEFPMKLQTLQHMIENLGCLEELNIPRIDMTETQEIYWKDLCFRRNINFMKRLWLLKTFVFSSD